ncbi:NGG1p interacting factor NIF3 [Salinicola avicenniae]|uniref:NGG1p interacting factor NIF3 n=1 Tax=Salinicola avicenniae TaxID=2916836 RepID=UPI00207356D3|nr:MULTISPECIES: NGG1p interacting factor NIF3 [unclassified Salinicola]
MYKLAFYVPETHCEAVKAAVFATGAGRLGDYEGCCFQTRGEGQFRPLDGADPHIGKVGDLTKIEEIKVELVCEEARIREAIAALLTAHPYETPAYDVWPLSDLASLPGPQAEPK